MSESANQPSRGGVDPLVGKVFGGRFKLLALVARGGMGKIYKAEQQPLGRVVALKVLDVSDDGDGEFRQRFFLEAAHCSKLSHPNTVRIFDYGETDDGIYYMTMEWLEGRNLHVLAKAEAPLNPLRAIAILREIGGALGEAHAAGIVHRDLKPANVLVTQHGEDTEFCKVLDFGLVKDMAAESNLSKTGHVLGSPMYMAPEQVNGSTIDGRTDIYAAGMILYVLLTGKTPFKPGNTLALLMAQVNRVPPSFAEVAPDVSVLASLEWVAQTALQKKPSKRFASFYEMLKALKACEKELRGEWSGPVSLALDAEGRTLLPDGLVVSEDIRLSSGSIAKLEDIPSSPTLLTKSMTRPVATVALGGLSFLIALGSVLLIASIAAVVIMLWAPWESGPIEVVTPTEVMPPTPIEAARVQVHLTSEPDGAELLRDGVVVGHTPFTLEMPEDEAWVLEVRANGFSTKKVRLAPDQPAMNVQLDRLPTTTTVPPLRAAPAPAPTPSPEPERRSRPAGDLRDPWAK